jgi:hypothetical protein
MVEMAREIADVDAKQNPCSTPRKIRRPDEREVRCPKRGVVRMHRISGAKNDSPSDWRARSGGWHLQVQGRTGTARDRACKDYHGRECRMALCADPLGGRILDRRPAFWCHDPMFCRKCHKRLALCTCRTGPEVDHRRRKPVGCDVVVVGAGA